MEENYLLLNIGIQADETTRGLQSCSVSLRRVPCHTDATPDSQASPDSEITIENEGAIDHAHYNIEPEDPSSDYDEQQLEASDLSLETEEWHSGEQTIECRCVSLQIDAAWAGPVILEVTADNLHFEAEAHLHAGLNSFFIRSDRFQKLKTERPLWRTVGKWILWILLAGVVTIAIWSMIDALWLDNKPAAVTDSAYDSADTVSDTLVIPPLPDLENTSQAPEEYDAPQNYSAAPSGSFADYNDFGNDSNALDEPTMAPPRKEKTYGIEP